MRSWFFWLMVAGYKRRNSPLSVSEIQQKTVSTPSKGKVFTTYFQHSYHHHHNQCQSGLSALSEVIQVRKKKTWIRWSQNRWRVLINFVTVILTVNRLRCFAISVRHTRMRDATLAINVNKKVSHEDWEIGREEKRARRDLESRTYTQARTHIYITGGSNESCSSRWAGNRTFQQSSHLAWHRQVFHLGQTELAVFTLTFIHYSILRSTRATGLTVVKQIEINSIVIIVIMNLFMIVLSWTLLWRKAIEK